MTGKGTFRFGRQRAAPTPSASTDPFIDDFLERHRWERWWGWYLQAHDHNEVRAGELYNCYADEAQAAGESVILSHRDFGIALQARGHETDRDSDGRYYWNLTVETLASELRALAIPYVCPDKCRQVDAKYRAVRMEIINRGAWDDLVESNADQRAELDALITSSDERAIIAFLRDEGFGPALDWQRGEDEPDLPPEWAWYERSRIGHAHERWREEHPGKACRDGCPCEGRYQVFVYEDEYEPDQVFEYEP